jgi:hypothetical protein
MERELAKIVLSASYRSGQELSNIVPLLKEFCPPEEYARIVFTIGSVLHELEIEIHKKIFEEHPDIHAEIEDRVQKYGRTF